MKLPQEIMATMNYKTTAEFQKDLKKLLKRFKTLAEDLEMVKENAIDFYHIKRIDNHSIFRIPEFCSDDLQICKIKKFACKALKGRGSKSGIRVIYAFHCKNFKVDFIEIYFKGDKENEDRERIKEYLSDFI